MAGFKTETFIRDFPLDRDFPGEIVIAVMHESRSKLMYEEQ
jgi:hypothetical protein